MNKITGIRSVDFKITALGYGVVNWNGPTKLVGDDGMDQNNHTLPKLRGYSNLSGKIKDETGFKYKKHASDINFKETPLYISQNCIRHHLFRDQAYDLHYAKDKNLLDILTSITGLIRGYVVPSSQCKRTSPLLLEDFVDQLGNGNFEQLSSSSSTEEITKPDGTKDYKRGENSIFSKTTFGETEYLAYGSISIEQLEFISLDKKFDRATMVIKQGEGEKIAEALQTFIKNLDPSREPKAVFHPNYVRGGTIFEEGETGILLDNVAIDILVQETLRMISELNIRQAKGYMYVESVLVDYNDSHKMMRIKRSVGDINETPKAPYAVYFYAKN
ncbi:MAG: type I-Fv CRISPR-associated protein Cas7fv [Methylococcales bacterium]|nr:type I-Fv CRISPR-associated protein Cas7fv [Methylococcales bacterium]